MPENMHEGMVVTCRDAKLHIIGMVAAPSNAFDQRSSLRTLCGCYAETWPSLPDDYWGGSSFEKCPECEQQRLANTPNPKETDHE